VPVLAGAWVVARYDSDYWLAELETHILPSRFEGSRNLRVDGSNTQTKEDNPDRKEHVWRPAPRQYEVSTPTQDYPRKSRA